MMSVVARRHSISHQRLRELAVEAGLETNGVVLGAVHRPASKAMLAAISAWQAALDRPWDDTTVHTVAR